MIKFCGGGVVMKYGWTAVGVCLWAFGGVITGAVAEDTGRVPHPFLSPSQDVALLLKRVAELNTRCRGGSGDDPDTLAACDARDVLVEELRARGWCYGRPDEPGYLHNWHPCGQ